MTEWFHPYLRAAINDMNIWFELNQGGLLPKLQHKDVLIHHCFEKMDGLLKLQRRWSRELPTIIQHTQRKISQTVRREGKQKFAQPEHLLTKLTEWAEEVYENEWGLITFSILRWHYWRDAASRNPVTFDELWIYCNDNSSGTDAERKF